MTEPYCDMSIAELEAERRTLSAQIRRAPAWSAQLATMNEIHRDCAQWLRLRRESSGES